MPEQGKETHGAMWSKDDPQPTPIHIMNIGSTEADRIRDLEEGHRDHEFQLKEHGQVLSDIRRHLGELVDRVDKFRLYFLLTAVIIFGGTDNGGKLVELIGKLFA